MPRQTPISLLALVLALACGSDSNSPDDEGTVAGTWSYRVDGLADAQYAGACSIAPTTLTLTQVGDSLHGTAGASFFICTPAGGAPDTIAIIPAGITVRGEMIDGDISFTIDGDYWSHEGEVFRDDMGGVASLTTQVGAETYDFVGGWESHRDD